MHIHILGICGTFMGGIAALARAAGHRVSGCDRNVYPPMSTQLAALGIELHEGYDAEQLAVRPDLLLVGNVMTRGMPVIEAMLDRALPYASGPEWLSKEMLRERWVLAVAGTHGKTTTTSLLAWILQDAGREPGFLIGGVPANFGISARLGGAPLFVIEADEYDTAFFDKRAKFVHYHARTLVLNNLEYCHAADASLERVLAAGCWTPVERFAAATSAAEAPLWSCASEPQADFSRFQVLQAGRPVGEVNWSLIGAHNADNALAE